MKTTSRSVWLVRVLFKLFIFACLCVTVQANGASRFLAVPSPPIRSYTPVHLPPSIPFAQPATSPRLIRGVSMQYKPDRWVASLSNIRGPGYAAEVSRGERMAAAGRAFQIAKLADLEAVRKANIAAWKRLQDRAIAIQKHVRKQGLEFQTRKRDSLVAERDRALAEWRETSRLVQEAARSMYQGEPMPRLTLYTAAIRRDREVDRGIRGRLPTYFEEAHEASRRDPDGGVVQRVISFPRGEIGLDKSGAAAERVLQEIVAAATAEKRKDSVVLVIGLASRTGLSSGFNELVSWGRAKNVGLALEAELGAGRVFSAGAYKMQQAGLHIDPERFHEWFGKEAEMLAGVGTDEERANQSAVILVLPAEGFEAFNLWMVSDRRSV